MRSGAPPSRVLPVVLPEVFTCAAAVYGGVGLAWHNVLRMPDSWLEHGPFRSWLVPGLLLLAVVAVPMGLAAVLELRRSAWAPLASVGAGSAQIGWIAVELLLLQKYDVLQPVMTGMGLLVLLLALWAHRARPLLPGRRPVPPATDGVHRDQLAAAR